MNEASIQKYINKIGDIMVNFKGTLIKQNICNRLTFLIGIILFCISSSATEVTEIHQNASSIISGIGVLDRENNALLYYKKEDNLYIKLCKPDKIEGLNPVEARQSCQDFTNKANLKDFKEQVSYLFFDIMLGYIKTQKSLEEFKSQFLSPQELQYITTQTDNLRNGIKAYKLKEKLKKYFDIYIKDQQINQHLNEIISKTSGTPSNQPEYDFNRADSNLKGIIKKVYENTEKLVENIPDFHDMSRVNNFKFSSYDLFYQLLAIFDIKTKFACGLNGTIEERIKDCSETVNFKNGKGFVLVTRSRSSINEYDNVHKDLNSGLIWGPTIKVLLNHYKAMTICEQDFINNTSMPKLQWALPTIEDWKSAEKSGFSLIFSSDVEAYNYFWSSTFTSNELVYVKYYSVKTGNYSNLSAHRQREMLVTCVSR